MKLKLTNVRLSFPDLFEAGEYEGKRTYGATFLIEPGSANDKAIGASMAEVAKEQWKEKGAAILKAAIAGGSNQKICYWDGSTKTYDGYEGMKALTAKRGEEKGRPLVLDKDKTPLVSGDGKPYAGCYVNASVELWAQDNKFGKSIRCTLLGVQFYADGDAFSAGSVADESDFDDLSVGGEEDPLM
jgi:hypothetical protein